MLASAQLASAQPAVASRFDYVQEWREAKTFYESCIGIDCVLNRRPYGQKLNARIFVRYCFGTACPIARFTYTDVFVDAESFSGNCTGISCMPTSQFMAASRAVEDDPTIVAYLEDRFERAPRAGQLYIALVIRAHDRTKGEALLRQLAQIEGETVHTFFGCIISRRTVASLAGEYLNAKDFRLD